MKKQFILRSIVFITLFFMTAQVSYAADVPSHSNDYYQIDHITSQSNRLKVSEQITEREPPKRYHPKGEREFSKEKYFSLLQKNSTANELRSLTKHPYHRFDIPIHKQIYGTDRITFTWQGNSLPGRQVTMYAWNHKKKQWLDLTSTIAQSSEIQLQASVKVGEFLHKNKISVLVQDQVNVPTKTYDYSFVWMSDTQYYAQNYPAIFKSITEWIAQNKAEMKIKYVFHTGDIVHKGHHEKQWRNADTYMNILDVANVPYGVLPGNHDEGDKFKLYKKYFGVQRFAKKRYYGEPYDENRGHYDLLSVNGKDYLFIYMGGDMNKEEITWMNNVLARYADRTAFLSFHEYLQPNGTRTHKGNQIFQEVVVPNQNVAAVLSGHFHGSAMLVDELDDNADGLADRKVYQLLADYQKAANGGNGFIRILHIDEETNSIDVQTYSPYLDEYYYYNPSEYPNKDLFNMDIDVSRTEKMIATSYFEAAIYRKLPKQKVGVNK
ncbi:metallophosphoesterase [Metabacillus malikii]|uniref:Calcineurin-like phosphoesterase domain-containing protein n=1 Tax=Metabacillus malikii TaxID=1504265 RepID=A0ABT9ZMG5_9BACI|nr:metallophosphoesterase [Metabacillus malikii]MDQ0233485.1 hypothetical protein [Metabacillus malikii]